MKNLTLDVILPVFNEEAEIAECLQALLKQGDTIGKIIVVDNNSTDSTVKIARDFAHKQKKIVLLFEKKQGQEYAIRTGFAHSKADILGRIDADTRVQPNWARNCIKFLTEHKEFGGCSGYTIYYDLPARKVSNFVSWLTVFCCQ